MRRFTVLLLAVLASPAAWGQEAKPTDSKRRPSAQAIEEHLERNRPKAVPVAPAKPRAVEQDNGSRAQLWADDKNLLWPEDFQLAMRRGQLRWTEPWWTFTFDADDEGSVDKPIKVLPSSKLRQMETYVKHADSAISFAITGRVTEYRDENYVLVGEVVILGRSHTQPAPTTEPAEQTEPDSPDSDAGATRILDLIEEDAEWARPLDSIAGAAPETDSAGRPTGRPSDTPVTDSAGLWSEGTRLTGRVGRLVREMEWWTLAFESDSDDPAEPAVRLLPNLSLQRMEERVAGNIQSLVFVVTGDITEYRAQNFLLVRRFAVRRDDGNVK